MTCAELLRKAFLRNPTVNIPDFAHNWRGRRGRHVTYEGLWMALQEFGPRLVETDGKGNWTCKDIEAMKAYESGAAIRRRAVKREAYARAKAKAEAPAAWAALLTAWGIPTSPPDGKKGTIHTMATAEDNKPEQLAWMD